MHYQETVLIQPKATYATGKTLCKIKVVNNILYATYNLWSSLLRNVSFEFKTLKYSLQSKLYSKDSRLVFW